MNFRTLIAASALLFGTLSVAQATQSTSAPQDPQQSSSPAAQQPTTQSPSSTTDIKPADTQQPPAATQPADAQQAPAAAPPDDAKSDDAKADDKDKKDSKKKDVKPGSKDDVESIGNRKVGGGKSLGDWYSLESEIRMGKQYAQQIEASVKLNQDPVINEYVNRVGQNLVRNSDARVPFTIKVVEDDSINAFALPGGFFYVNTGLILAADEEAELAGVMAHEIAHVAARHATRQMTRSQWANIGTIPLIFVG